MARPVINYYSIIITITTLSHYSNNSWTDAAGMAALYGMCTESSSGIVSVIGHMGSLYKGAQSRYFKLVLSQMK